MKAQSDIQFLSLLGWFAKAASLVACATGLVVLMGWFVNMPILKSLFLGMPSIRFNTAFSFLLLGSSLWLLQEEEIDLFRKRLGKTLAGAVLLISLLTLSEYLFRWNLGIDQLFIRDLDSPLNLFPGRMSPIAVLDASFCSLALLMLGSKTSQYFSISALNLSLVTILSYMFDFQLLYRHPEFTYAAFFPGMIFLLISLAIIAVRPTRGMMNIFTSNLPGSKAMRFMLPGMILLTLFIGWLVEQGEKLGTLDTSKESILLVILLILVYSPLIYLIANHINRAEERILYLNRLYATLSQVNQTIVRVKSQQELFESICDVAVQFAELPIAWIGLLDESTGNIKPVFAKGLDVNHWPFPTINIDQGPTHLGIAATAMRISKVMISDDIQTDPRTRDLHIQLQEYGYHSMAVVPFRLQGHTTGALNLISREPGFFKNKEELRLLEEMGLDISFALDTIANEDEQEQAEERSRESEELFRTAFQYSPVGMCLTTLDGKLQTVNQSFADMLGFTKEELQGKHFNDITHSEDKEIGRDALKEMISGEVPNISFEKRYVQKTGETVWAYISVALLKDSSGKPLHFIAQILNITERKQAEEAYAASQRHFQALIEHAPDGIALLGFDGKLQQVTHSTESILGYSLEEAKGQDPALLTHPEDLPSLLMLLNDLLQNPGKVMRTEYRFRHKDGSWRYLESTISNMLNEPSLKAVVFNYRDITERKESEEALRRSRETYQELFENNPHPMWVYDLETLVLKMVNDAATEHYGYSKEEFLDMTIKDIRPKADLPSLVSNLELARLPLEKSTGWRHRKKDGTLIDVEITSHAIQFEGRPARLVLANDVTERKRAEEALRLSEEKYRTLVEMAEDVILLTDLNGKHLYRNSAYYTSLGFEVGEEVDLDGYGHVHPDDVPQMKKVTEDLMSTGTAVNEYRVQHKDGHWVTRQAKVVTTYDQAHKPEALLSIIRDITKRKRYEEELRTLNSELEQRVAERTAEFYRMNVELEQANKAKDEFLANMSHELRTPLNSILGLSESLLEQRRGSLNEHQQTSLQIIESSGHHLLGLINDILDISKIEAGKLDFYPQSVSVDEVCRSSLTFIKMQAMKKSIAVTYTNQSKVSEMFADARRLKQVLVNLLTNAVKFTPQNGQITLRVSTKLEQNLIQFSVIDNGVGIAPKDLQGLFRPFVQVDSSLNRQYEGTGLGLALVQKLTDLHGGSVQVESEVGKGSCFTINLACNQENSINPETSESNQGLISDEQTGQTSTSTKELAQRAVILLAEDNMSNILAIGEYVESYGYKVIVAHDGLDAIAKAEQVKPDLILMDIQMPAMNGLEAIAHLRADFRFASTPIIALTALAMPGDRERCLQVGASEYMSKPVSLKILIKTIERMLEVHK